MKRVSLLALLVILTIPTYAWKPIFVGHRGSYRGVSNTAEAFRNGVDNYGYTGLECDVRVTSDGEYVIMHDETTKSLGGNLTVATSTLAQLKGETLTQTRSGNTYTGKICTVAEYLDICIEKNAFPVIELKWTTGINNNDMSNFPGLMDIVIEKGILDKAVFLTSMKSSIEYIRTNYPAAKCQFLTGQYWESHFDWCVKWNVMPSIQIGYFDIYTVQKFRNVGLDVAMWTLNSESNYMKYGNTGVCMMTCDYLYADEMPELDDIEWDKIPVRYDPLEIETQMLWSYRDRDDNLPSDFPNGTSAKNNSAQQATVVNGTFYTNNYTTNTLLAIHKDGTITESAGSNSPGITRDDAGNLILRNDGENATEPNSILIYRRGETSNPTELNFSLLNNGVCNYISASGDIFSSEGGYLYLFTSGTKYVNFVKIVNGAVEAVTTSQELSVEATDASLVIPINNDPNNFIYQVPLKGYYRYKDGADAADYLTSGATSRAPARNITLGGALLLLDGHEILVHTSGVNYYGGLTVKDITADKASLKTFETAGSNGSTANTAKATFLTAVKENDKCYTVYAYTMGNGYVAYEIALEGASVEDNLINNHTQTVCYPNPATDRITINNNTPIQHIAIYTINGAMMGETAANNTSAQTISTTSLPQGVYIVKVNNSNACSFIKK